MGLCVERGGARELLVDGCEVARDQWAKVRQRATRVNEGDEQGFAPELAEVNGAAILVEELEVGYRVAGPWNMICDGRPVVRFTFSDDDDVVEKDVGVGILRDQNVGGEHVAGVKFAQDGRVLELVG